MSDQNNPYKGGTTGGNPTGGQQSRVGGESFNAQDIKSLVNNQGRVNLGGQDWALKAPSLNDTSLQTIISDPNFTVKPSGKPVTDGKFSYEISGHGKTIEITISR